MGISLAKVEPVKGVFNNFKPDVVNMDIEGAELDILQSKDVDYAGIDLMFCEYSSAKGIKAHGPESFNRFRKVLYNLQQRGFEYLDIPAEFLRENRWDPGHHQAHKDLVFVASRSRPTDGRGDAARYQIWKSWALGT